MLKHQGDLLRIAAVFCEKRFDQITHDVRAMACVLFECHGKSVER